MSDDDDARFEAGGLPASAERRLAELAGGTMPYTSTLSVSGLALAAREGVVPISQVMGSSVYKLGWSAQNMPGRNSFSWTQRRGTELLADLSRGWNEVRELALGRMRQEAERCGADAVIGVRLERSEHDVGEDTIEFTAFGTAVRLPPAPARRGAPDGPVLSALALDEWWKLHRAGYSAAGVAATSTAVYVHGGWSAGFRTRSWSNQELPEFTQGVYDARELALMRWQQGARELGADGVVGVTIEHDIKEIEYERNDTRYVDLVATFHLLGTAIVRGAPGAGLPETLTAVPLTARPDPRSP